MCSGEVPRRSNVEEDWDLFCSKNKYVIFFPRSGFWGQVKTVGGIFQYHYPLTYSQIRRDGGSHDYRCIYVKNPEWELWKYGN